MYVSLFISVCYPSRVTSRHKKKHEALPALPNYTDISESFESIQLGCRITHLTAPKQPSNSEIIFNTRLTRKSACIRQTEPSSILPISQWYLKIILVPQQHPGHPENLIYWSLVRNNRKHLWKFRQILLIHFWDILWTGKRTDRQTHGHTPERQIARQT